jgi:hypothetical protein
MSRKQASTVPTAATILLAFGLILPQTGRAGQDLNARKAASDGSHQGIKVHGHWTIEVRNPDGTLVSHRELENALIQGTASGSGAIAALLGRANTAGFWQVGLSGGAGGTANACSGGAGAFTVCYIAEPSDTGIGGGLGVAKTLTVSAPTSGANAGQLVLAGAMAAPATGTITSVITNLELCAPSVPLGGCNGSNNSSSPFITSATFSSISVVAAQTIQVTVVLSFS